MASVEKRIRDGKVSWLARWRDPTGRQRKKSFSRKVDAERYLTSVKSSILQGAYIDPSAGRVTVGTWAQQWLETQSHLKATTRQRYVGIVRSHVVPRWATVSLAAVSHADVAAWLAGLSANGLSPASVRYVHRVFSLMMDMAVRDGRITKNPALGVALPRILRREPTFLSLTEIDQLARAAGEHGLVLRVLAFTGLRFGELAALEVNRVDLPRRRIVVAESVSEVSGQLVWSTPKNHQTRSVPLIPALVEPLRQACAGKAGDDLVFTSPEGHVLRINNWRPRVFDPACRAAALSGVTPPDLRHTAASLAVSAGANVKAVQRMLGHASASMTLDVYAGLFADDLDDVAARLGRMLDAQGTST